MRIAVALLALLLGVPFAFCAEAHLEMRRIAPERPSLEAIESLARVSDAPRRVTWINTASQPGTGPTVAHPAFLLEWSDGRGLLIDAGMDREAALEFGRLGELAFGSDPIEPHGSVAEQLGDFVGAVRGIAFTHLHTDHTNGIRGLCEGTDRQLTLFQTPDQASRQNYTTSPGRAHLAAAACAHPVVLEGGPLHALPGFPGVGAVAAGGHTPGSTIFFAPVDGTLWVFAGDVSNFRSNLLANRPKPWVYSVLIVPENRARLASLRRWLAELDARPDVRVVVSHDRDAIEASGLPAWTAPDASG